MKVSSHPSQTSDNPSEGDIPHKGGGRNTVETFRHRIGAKVLAVTAFLHPLLAVRSVSVVDQLECLGQRAQEDVICLNGDGQGPWRVTRSLDYLPTQRRKVLASEGPVEEEEES